VTKNFIKYKSTALMVNKAAIPAAIAKKMGI
jgi:bleomycin hydrolase